MGTELCKLRVQATVLDRDDDAPTPCVADTAGRSLQASVFLP